MKTNLTGYTTTKYRLTKDQRTKYQLVTVLETNLECAAFGSVAGSTTLVAAASCVRKLSNKTPRGLRDRELRPAL